MTISFPTEIFNEGEVVTIRQNVLTIDEYGDTTFSGALVTLSGLIVPSSSSNFNEKMGIIDTKDALGFFDPTDVAKIKNGNDLYCNLGSFSMDKVVVFPIAGSPHHIEVELRNLIKL